MERNDAAVRFRAGDRIYKVAMPRDLRERFIRYADERHRPVSDMVRRVLAASLGCRPEGDEIVAAAKARAAEQVETFTRVVREAIRKAVDDA